MKIVYMRNGVEESSVQCPRGVISFDASSRTFTGKKDEVRKWKKAKLTRNKEVQAYV